MSINIVGSLSRYSFRLPPLFLPLLFFVILRARVLEHLAAEPTFFFRQDAGEVHRCR
jgi:hypothetical protein